MTEQAAAAGAVATTGARPRVVVIGGGFGGLNAVRELADADADVTRGGPDEPPPVPAAALPGGRRDPAARADRAGAAQHRQEADERPRAARRGDEHRPREARGPHRGARRTDAHPGLRHAGRRGRGDALLLRPRRVRRVRARYEDHRGRPVPARPDPVGVRARRAVDGPGRAGRAADVRGDRGRADRCGDGRADRGAGAHRAAARLPVDQHPRGAHHPAGGRARGAAAVRQEAAGLHAPGRWRRWGWRSTSTPWPSAWTTTRSR